MPPDYNEKGLKGSATKVKTRLGTGGKVNH